MVVEPILLTIAARGGSKGVKDKNIRDLCGLPLIAHTINQAKRWGKATTIICSTDSDAIANEARRFGAEVPFKRPDGLATDTAGKIGVLRHALSTMRELTGIPFGIVVDLDVTAPIRRIEDIEKGLQIFLEKRPDVVASVVPARRNPYFNMLEQSSDGYVHVAKQLPGGVTRRQDAPIVYDMNASIYVYDSRYLLNPETRTATGGKTLPLVMDEHSAFDIDSEEDFQLIEYLVSRKLVTL
jgi:CMP-N,N'-diacetyllegionaminic acid synthase